MPWKEDGPMELRAELIREWKEGESVTALAEAYGFRSGSDRPEKHAKLEGDAMEGRRTNGTPSRTDSRVEGRRERHSVGGSVRRLSQDDLQVAGAPRE